MYKKKEIKEARKTLMSLIPKGTRLVANVASVSRSGMSRKISFYTIGKDTQSDGKEYYRLYRISRYIAVALEWGYCDKECAVKVSGCGMDMIFHTLNQLGYVLYDDEYAFPEAQRI